MSVKFFTTARLAGKYCESCCILVSECSPKFSDNGENDSSGMNILVIGNIAATECPIMARIWPFAGWVDAKNHRGRCGEQER